MSRSHGQKNGPSCHLTLKDNIVRPPEVDFSANWESPLNPQNLTTTPERPRKHKPFCADNYEEATQPSVPRQRRLSQHCPFTNAADGGRHRQTHQPHLGYPTGILIQPSPLSLISEHAHFDFVANTSLDSEAQRMLRVA